MKTPIYDMLGSEFPLAFSHCREVVAAVSTAGGFDILGGVGHTLETLDIELFWIGDQVKGKPYGVDLIVPTSLDSKEEALAVEELERRIPPEHKAYACNLLAHYGFPTDDFYAERPRAGVRDNYRAKGAGSCSMPLSATRSGLSQTLLGCCRRSCWSESVAKACPWRRWEVDDILRGSGRTVDEPGANRAEGQLKLD